MTPIKQGKYKFIKKSLIDVRTQIGINQKKMAEILGVPSNTLSRWETGATVPDANNLAAFYSVAKEHNITPSFFEIPDSAKSFPYNLIVIWDFQTSGISPGWLQFTHGNIMGELQKRFGGMNPLMKVFTDPTQGTEADILKNLGWTVIEEDADIRKHIIDDARSDCGQNPEGTVFILISIDNEFEKLIDELSKKGVKVYVISNQMYNNKLIAKVGQTNTIPWYPIALEQPKRAINNFPSGEPTNWQTFFNNNLKL